MSTRFFAVGNRKQSARFPSLGRVRMISLLQHCRQHTVAILALGAALASPSAWAAGTASGVDITNNASVTYSVNSVSQTTPSNSVTFKVDNVVRLTVSESGSSATIVVPNASAQVTTFTVTNNGNTTQDYALAAANLANGQTVTLGANTYTDNFQATSCSAYVESGTNAGYQAGQDTATSISNLAADGSTTVYVVCNIPSGQVNNDAAVVSLTATTANAASCATACTTTTETTGADTPGSVDVVFGDVNGSDDSSRDGKHSARDAYVVKTATLSISKTVTALCDPFNFNGTGGAGFFAPKNVPGAYVRYAITVANAAGSGASATLTTIGDVLPAALGYDAHLRQGSASACAASNPESALNSGFKLVCTGGTRACASAAVYYTGASDTDAITVSGQTVTVTAGDTPTGNRVLGAEAVPGYAAGELKPGESITIHFNAIIQ